MALVDTTSITNRLSPPLDRFLATQLIDEFVRLERRYVLRDWEPAELDGAHFCEVLARALYHLDSGNLDLARDFGNCSRYIHNDNVQHIIDRDATKMLFMVATVVHKFRSKRGVGHVSPTYSANHMDARYMMEAVRWAMVEVLRLFATGDRDVAAKMIAEILQFEVPCVGRFEDVVMVQRTDLRPDEELLVLLHYAGSNGYTRRELGIHAMWDPPQVTRALQSLVAPNRREVVQLTDGRYVLSDLGHKQIREKLAAKLVLE